ncbi:class I SAM-dependent methyltransferase [Magnetovibrio sp.]|uniref:class I SAM-dependent methyltransferase n=1 Tax=Magnetovibrio sp. TaxID=2024836 RepID=UPI002F94C41A
MAEINLLNQYPKARRNLVERKKSQEENRAAALRFGREYFDGTREQGYGGYTYDGRWQPIAKEIISHYNLKPGDRVLDIGCAKGYLVKDLTEACPGLEVIGMDISQYALDHAPEETKAQLMLGTADELPFEDDSFDAVLCINVLHNLERDRCIKAIQEIERVAPGRSYIQVDAYRNDSERDLFLDWVLTAVTFGNLDFWREMFAEAGYTGDYYWTIIEADPDWVVTQ